MSSLPEQIESDKPVGRIRKAFSWPVIRFTLAAVILTAAGLKAHQLATTPSLGNGILEARWFNIFVVEFELLFGFWLVFGLLPKLTWLASFGLFSVFATVSAFKGIAGEASCGCFGAVAINPWLTAVFDLGVVGMLGWVSPRNLRCENSTDIVVVLKKRQVLGMIVLWICTAVPLTVAMMSVQTIATAELGTEFVGADGRKTVTLEPSKWAGKDFALTLHTDLHGKLKHGVWLVLLHTHTCSSCRESVRLYRELAIEFAVNDKAPKIAMIELPPYDSEASEPNDNDPVQYGKLDKSRAWKIKSPALLLIDEHKVQNVFDNSLDTELIRSIWGAEEK